jgi:fructose-1,6-bisphosphatase-3
MNYTRREITEDLRFLTLLSREYPTIRHASTEIINLQAILNLPKGTEHFMSDIHGEHEAFQHIMNNASGVIREKVDILFADSLSDSERDTFATLIYYPVPKLKELTRELADPAAWYTVTLQRLLAMVREVSSKYTRSKVRKALPAEYAYIIEELLYSPANTGDKEDFFRNIFETIIAIGRADDFIISLCATVKELVVDRLHIVGDIFDRGPRPDIVMNTLMRRNSIDIQWGNHDVLWMGAATGSRTCIAAVLHNSVRYNNLDVVETGYAISLRPLSVFAADAYRDSDLSCFIPKGMPKSGYSDAQIDLVARMYKAIAVIQFKLEGHIIRRNPQFGMEDRLLLGKIDFRRGAISLNGEEHPLLCRDFPTIDPADPYRLTPGESDLMATLRDSFVGSEKLQRHVNFLYAKGSLYRCFNDNLMFHSCIPTREDGSFMEFNWSGEPLSGKAFLDYCDAMARKGYYAKLGSAEKTAGMDLLWFLWCGKHSPLFGRSRITTFERLFIADKKTHEEPKNPYYAYFDDEGFCEKVLAEFGLHGKHCHIINGHLPVRFKDGESPIKANGRLIVIDGGFSRAYQPTTGIAGYTLIYNSTSLRLSSHEPFESTAAAIRDNKDILSSSTVFEHADRRVTVAETDDGKEIRRNVEDLKRLLSAYYMGLIKEAPAG